jgi:hypothetical protein
MRRLGPSERNLGGPQGRCTQWKGAKEHLATAGIETRFSAFQAVASRLLNELSHSIEQSDRRLSKVVPVLN